MRRSEMAVDGVHHLLIETHNWGKSVAFWKQLGWELAEERGTSGILRPAHGGPYIYLAEVAPDRTPTVEVYFNVADADRFAPKAPVQVVAPFAPTHWGTRLMEVRDPDGRVVKLQAS